MISAGIKDVKNNLSRLLSEVKAGEEVLITERGRPVARIIKENSADQSIRAALMPLIQKGLVSMPSQNIRKDSISALKVSGSPVSEMVIQDRR